VGKGLALIYPTYGHITPALAVVEELVRRGESLVFYATGRSRARVEQTGARFEAYERGHDEFNPDPPTDGLLSDMARLLALSETLLPRLLAEVAQERPDYLLVDTKSVWGRLVGQFLGLRTITLSVVFAIKPDLVAVPDLVNWLYAGASPERLVNGLQQLACYADTARRIAARHDGVRAPDIVEFLGNPQPLNIIFTSRAFQLQGDAFEPDAYKFVGVSIADGRDAQTSKTSAVPPAALHEALPAALPAASIERQASSSDRPAASIDRPASPSDREFRFDRIGTGAMAGAPLVYVSLGTTFNDAPEFYRACFEAFDGQPYQVVISTGGRAQALADRGEENGPPANVIVCDFVPQLPLLARASAFVTHGGMNSANEGLHRGAPMVVVPQRGDQYLVAARIAELGAGLMLTPRDLTPDRLRQAVGRVLAEPAFRARAQALGAGLDEAGGFARAADEILAAR
jgi:UDP:flavonoid glycosyltransferase YjiC (YdhE family)